MRSPIVVALSCLLLPGCSLALDFYAALPCETAADCEADYRCHLGRCASPDLEQCGDLVVDAGESCDDGNAVDDDGCQSDCTVPLCGADPCGGAHATSACVDSTCFLTCDLGWASCDDDLGNGCEQDVSTDASHCGACDHACPGACTWGACVLGAGSYSSIAADDTDVFWYDSETGDGSGTIRRVSMTGTADSLFHDPSDCNGLAVTSTDVVWADFGGQAIMAKPKPGGSVSAIASGVYQANGVATRGDHVLWRSQAGEIGFRPSGGSAIQVAADVGTFAEIGLGPARIYYAGRDVGLQSQTFALTDIKSHWHDGDNDVVSMAADATHVYWAADDDIIRRMPAASNVAAEIEVIATDLTYLDHLRVDDTHLYWSRVEVIERWHKQSGLVETLYNHGGPGDDLSTQDIKAFTLTDDYVLFSTYASDGTIGRLKK